MPTFEMGVQNELNSSTPWLRMFENMDTGDWTGTSKAIKVRVNRNRGVYSASERGAKPGRGQQRLEDLTVHMRYIYGGIELTEQVIQFSRSNRAAAVSALQDEMDGLVDDLRVQRSFYMCTGYGMGIRCLANGNPGTGTTFEVDAPGGVAGSVAGGRYLNEGDHIVAIDPTAGTLRAGGTREISGIDAANDTITVTAALNAAWADNDQIVKAYDSDASIAINNTDYAHTPMGLLGLIDDGTYNNSYFGINRTTFPIMSSYVLSSVGALSADVVMRGIHRVFQIGRGRPRYHWMHPSVLRSYITLTQSDRRYTAGELMSPDAGTVAADQTDESNTGLKFGNVPIHIDQDLPYGMWFGIDTRGLRRYVGNPGSWVNRDGNMFFRATGTVDTWEAEYRVWENFVDRHPNRSFRLEDITANVVVVHRV